jgi:predicted secreted Zn-dependent protease
MVLHRFPGIVAFAMAAFAAPAAHATLHYEERTEPFEIGAGITDSASLWQAIRRFGPEAGGAHAIGTAGAKTSWTRTLQRGPLGCKLKTIDVTMNVSLALPTWQGRSRAAPDLQKYWDCVAKTVTTHEKRHAQIWREAGHKLDTELNALTAWLPCGQLDEQLKETADRIQSEARGRQAAFDDEDRRRPRYEQCKAELKKTADAAETKAPVAADAHNDTESGDTKGAGKTGAGATVHTTDTEPDTLTKDAPPSSSRLRLGTRIKMVSGDMSNAAGSSIWLLLWLGGLLAAGTAALTIFMKHRLNQGDETAVEEYKERSALLRLARKVDASTGKHISRSSLPDRTGLRRRPLRRT